MAPFSIDDEDWLRHSKRAPLAGLNFKQRTWCGDFHRRETAHLIPFCGDQKDRLIDTFGIKNSFPTEVQEAVFYNLDLIHRSVLRTVVRVVAGAVAIPSAVVRTAILT